MGIEQGLVEKDELRVYLWFLIIISGWTVGNTGKREVMGNEVGKTNSFYGMLILSSLWDIEGNP